MERRKKATLALAFGLACALAPSALWAQPKAEPACSDREGDAALCSPKGSLPTDFRPATSVEYALLLVGALTLVGTELYLDSPAIPSHSGGVLFDDFANKTFPASSSTGRNRAGALSDALLAAELGITLVDLIVVPGFRDNFSTAIETGTLALEAFTVSGLVDTLTKRLVARERPDAQACVSDATFSTGCQKTTNESFPSGHSTVAFTSAGLLCYGHLRLSLLKSPTADVIACSAGLGVATTVGALRVVAGRHYASDVLGGAVLGLASGFGLPELVQLLRPSPTSELTLQVLPLVRGRLSRSHVTNGEPEDASFGVLVQGTF